MQDNEANNNDKSSQRCCLVQDNEANNNDKSSQRCCLVQDDEANIGQMFITMLFSASNYIYIFKDKLNLLHHD